MCKEVVRTMAMCMSGSGVKLYRCVFAHFTEYNRVMHHFTLSWKESNTAPEVHFEIFRSQSRKNQKHKTKKTQKKKKKKPKKNKTKHTKKNRDSCKLSGNFPRVPKYFFFGFVFFGFSWIGFAGIWRLASFLSYTILCNSLV